MLRINQAIIFLQPWPLEWSLSIWVCLAGKDVSTAWNKMFSQQEVLLWVSERTVFLQLNSNSKVSGLNFTEVGCWLTFSNWRRITVHKQPGLSHNSIRNNSRYILNYLLAVGQLWSDSSESDKCNGSEKLLMWSFANSPGTSLSVGMLSRSPILTAELSFNGLVKRYRLTYKTLISHTTD